MYCSHLSTAWFSLCSFALQNIGCVLTALLYFCQSAGAVTFRWGGPTGSTIQLGKIGQDYFGISHPDQTVIR